MLIQFSLHRIKTLEISDHPYDPFDNQVELYQTWQICDIDPNIIDDSDNRSTWARQGFCTKGEINSGIVFKNKKERILDDPKIVFSMHELENGERKKFKIIMHWWESESSTRKIKGAFTDATLKVMYKSFIASKKDICFTKDKVEHWISENNKDLTKAILKYVNMESLPGVRVDQDMSKIFPLLIDMLKYDPDDYLGLHEFYLDIEKSNDQIQWKISPKDAPYGEWIEGEGVASINVELMNEIKTICLEADYFCRIIE